MATPKLKACYVTTLLVLSVLFVPESSSAARVLSDGLFPAAPDCDVAAASTSAHPASNLAVPGHRRALVATKYGVSSSSRLFLQMLPKGGTVPPSAPSNGKNSVNN